MTDESQSDDVQPQVAAALAVLEARDPAVARDARAAWAWLAGDAPPGALLQRQLQDFLWHGLPREWACDLEGHLAVVEALARLFDLLDIQRYAQLCRAEETREILAAYDRDARKGVERYQRAVDRSGIVPPDVPELVWGKVRSVEEAMARDHVAARLEEAVRDGRIVPPDRGWRTAQRAVTSEALAESVPDHPGGQTWLQTVVTARLTAWIERYGGSPRRWRLVQRLEAALLHPVPVPDDAAEVVAPLRWLLERASGDGLALTERGNLSRSLVQQACARFGWEPLGPGTTVQRQDDIVELLVWDEFIRSARLVRRRGGRLVATPAGRTAADDVEGAWRALAAGLIGREPWNGFLFEAALLLLLDAGDDGLTYRRMNATLAELATEAGWRDDAAGGAPSSAAVSRRAGPFVHHLQLMGLAERHGDPLHSSTRLLPVGRSTAIEALRTRGRAPGDSVHR